MIEAILVAAIIVLPCAGLLIWERRLRIWQWVRRRRVERAPKICRVYRMEDRR